MVIRSPGQSVRFHTDDSGPVSDSKVIVGKGLVPPHFSPVQLFPVGEVLQIAMVDDNFYGMLIF